MNIYLIGMLISMAVYVVLGLVIGKSVKDTNDFYVAGRRAPTILIVGSLVASYCSTGIFMGEAGEAYSGLFSPLLTGAIMQLSGYVLGAVFFGRYLRRSEVYTIPEFLGKRFNSKAMRVLSMVTATVTLVVYLLSVMQGIGTLMNVVTGLDYNLCVLLAMIVFTLLTVSSGAKGVLISDTFMFGIFTVATLASVFVIAAKAGGWYEVVATVTHLNEALLSWSGDLGYLYPSGGENMIWALSFGLVWMSVCMVGPWQTSRYLMAKNEHVVVRSSVGAAAGAFMLHLLIYIGAVFVRAHNPNLENSSHVLIWAAMNVLPTVLGVVMLTGVLAAGISSATTFLSLIGSSVSNDILQIQDEKKKFAMSKVATAAAAILVLILSYFNPPQIFWILLLGATVVASSWLPVCIASVWSKRVTKAGAFCGMLFGFIGCGAVKIYTSVTGATLPAFLDPFFVGVVMNILAMVIASALTKVTPEEKAALVALHVMPESEKDPTEVKRTKKVLVVFVVLCGIMALGLILLWALPYRLALA